MLRKVKEKRWDLKISTCGGEREEAAVRVLFKRVVWRVVYWWRFSIRHEVIRVMRLCCVREWRCVAVLSVGSSGSCVRGSDFWMWLRRL